MSDWPPDPGVPEAIARLRSQPDWPDHEGCLSCGAEVDHYLGCPDDPHPDYEAEAALARSQPDPETTGSGPYWEVIPDPNSDYPERRGLDPDPDRCPSCGHPADMFCEDLCCLDDHAEAIGDV